METHEYFSTSPLAVARGGSPRRYMAAGSPDFSGALAIAQAVGQSIAANADLVSSSPAKRWIERGMA